MPANLRWLLLVGLLASRCLVAHTQPLPKIISAEDFLGRSAAFVPYDIDIDTNGLICFVGRSGLQVFNGTTCSKPPPAMGTGHKAIFGAYKDYSGQLWFRMWRGIAYLDGDSLRQLPLPDSVTKRFAEGLEAFYRDSAGTFHIAPRSYGYYTVSKTGELTEVIGRASGYNGFAFFRLPDGTPFHFSVLPPTDARNANMQLCRWDNEQQMLHPLAELPNPKPHYESSLVQHGSGSYFLSTGTRNIVEFTADSLVQVHALEFPVIKLFMDSRNDLWIGSFDHGLFRARNAALHTLDHFAGESTTAVTAEDLDGGLWLKSNSLRFGYLPYPALSYYAPETGYPNLTNIHVVTGSDEQVFCLTTNQAIFELRQHSITQLPTPQPPIADNKKSGSLRLRRMVYDTANASLWCGMEGAVAQWNGQHWQYYLLPTAVFHNTLVLELKMQPDGSLMGATKHELFAIKNNELTRLSEVQKSPIQTFATAPNGEVWVACNSGLWKLHNRTFVRPFEPMPPDLLEPFYYLTCTQGALWAQPVDKKLYRISGDTASVALTATETHFSTSAYSVAPSGKLWTLMQHNSDVTAITSAHGQIESQSIAFVDATATARTKYRLLATDSAVYLASDIGLFTEKIARLQPQPRSVRIVLQQVLVNYEPAPLKATYSLKPQENNITVTFTGLNFSRLPEQYRYRIAQLDSTWRETNFPQVQYTNLPPGQYLLEVQGRLPHYAWGKSQTVRLRIAKPYWQTWWFRAVVLGALVLGIFLLMQWRSRAIATRERQKNAFKLELAQLELRALKAQINPHFIFNSLSSVLFYLSTNKPEDAQSYLQRFALLIRAVLEHSESTMVPLQQEIALIENYVSLESERLQGSAIELQLTYDDVEPQLTMIPPALFQPYIENAIWHGLKYKEDQRIIRLQFKRLQHKVQVIIEDNGIGRTASRQLGTGHKAQRSFGMLIAARRIELLHQNALHQVHIRDLTNAQGDALGTRIEFVIPFVVQQ